MLTTTRALVRSSLLAAVCIAHSVFAQATVVGSTSAQFEVSGGSVNYLIPIQAAPGRGGMQPDLSFNYAQGGGNSVLGVN